MSDKSGIEWTDATWNPVTGCTHVSAGCRNCYAERIANRFKGGKAFPDGFKVTLHPERLNQPLRWTRPRKIFVNSMSDLFHEDVQDDFIAAVFCIMAAAPQHSFQVLTKRPERMLKWVNSVSEHDDPAWIYLNERARKYGLEGEGEAPGPLEDRIPWPLSNVWLGVSVENQATADKRIPLLLATPAAVRFISAEPLLGPIRLWYWSDEEDGIVGTAVVLHSRKTPDTPDGPGEWIGERYVGLDWVIVGGESGPKARPFDVAWARSVVEQCRDAGVACFVKQLGAIPFIGDGKHTHIFGHRGFFVQCDQGDPCPYCGKHPITNWPTLKLNDRKGGDIAEWPADLRVREFPFRMAKV